VLFAVAFVLVINTGTLHQEPRIAVPTALEREIINTCTGTEPWLPVVREARPWERVAVLIVSTGKYADLLLEKQIQSVLDHWHSSPGVDVFVWTDREINLESGKLFFLEHRNSRWPVSTYERPELFLSRACIFEGYDYLFTIDADLLVIGEVTAQINGDLVAMLHPGYFLVPDQQASLPYERNPQSTAFIDPKEANQNGRYYQGCFYGGRTGQVVRMWRDIKENLERDLANGIVAIYHEESHLNRYLRTNPPAKEVSHSYGFPEGWDLPGEKIIVHLDKGKLGGHSSFQT